MPVIRRSRSLSELPGSIRVPILRRTDSDRMRARLEASMQGLEELKLLKEQQKKIIDDAMTSSFQRSGRSNIQQVSWFFGFKYTFIILDGYHHR